MRRNLLYNSASRAYSENKIDLKNCSKKHLSLKKRQNLESENRNCRRNLNEKTIKITANSRQPSANPENQALVLRKGKQITSVCQSRQKKLLKRKIYKKDEKLRKVAQTGKK